MRGTPGFDRICHGPAAPAIMAGMAIVSAVTSAIGTISSAQASASQAAYQAQVARNNQIVADRAAQDALKRGQVEEDKLRQRNAAILGRQRAELAGQGTLLDEGSPLDIQGDTAALGELDALTLRSGYEREAYSHKVQGMNQAAQASLYDSKSSTGLGTWLAAGGSIIGGAAKAYSAFGGGGGGAGGLRLDPTGLR